MAVVSSSFFLFALIFLLIVVFHCYFWDFNYSVFSGVRSWGSSFECGFLSQGVSENYFSCTYFLLLVFFVLFDLEVSLLLNLPFEGLLFKNFGYYLFFLLCVSFGYLFEVKGGYVGWSV